MPHILLPIILLTLILCGIECSKFGVFPLHIYTRLNTTFEVSCYVSDIDGDLNFYDGNALVDESLIKRVNGSFITYKNSCTKPTKKNLTCKRGEHNIDTTVVFVDGGIEVVSEFECGTKDLKHLTCGFRQSPNIIPNSYSLHYVLNDNAKTKKQIELIPDYKGRYSTKPIKINKYNGISRMNFDFSLKAQRMKILEDESRVENFKIELLEALLPLPVENIEVINQNNSKRNDVEVILTIPKDLEKIVNHLMFDIRLKARDENESAWTENILTDLKKEGNKVFVPLTDLKYADTIYQFQVRFKSKTSNETNKKVWSEYENKVFKTDPRPPVKLPHVCQNCYSIMDNGNVFIYWMEVPKFFQNGDNFTYELRIKNEKEEEIDRVRVINPSYVLKHKTVKIEIFAVNALGISEHHRTIHVTTKNKKSLLRIKKELFNDVGYKLSWKILDDNLVNIESFTIIWCKQRNELANQCDGPITFQNILNDQTNFYLNTSKSFQFGIAVNQANVVTGFEWAKCTASSPDEIGKIQSIWDDGKVKDTSISIAWDVNCADKDIIQAFNISYGVIPMISFNKSCEPPQFQLINLGERVSVNKYLFTSLKPYTKYNISVAMISTSGRMGPFSKPILVQTMEGTPTAPRNLTFIDIRETSVDLMWRRPKEVNGPSLTYQLWCNEKSFHIDTNETMNEFFYYTLENLESYTSYSIRVIAQTRNSSEPSERLVITTRVGVPGPMMLPLLRDMKNGSLKLEWKPPKHLGGFLDFYQLNVSIHRDNFFRNFSLYRVSGKRTSCLVNFDESYNHEVYFYIRAVNIKEDRKKPLSAANESIYCLEFEDSDNAKEVFYGEWSAPIVHLSFYTGMLKSITSSSMGLVVTFCFAITLLSFLSYCILKLYQKIQKIKDIKAIYPEGLNPNEPALSNIHGASRDVSNVDLLRTYVLTDIEEEDITREISEKGCDDDKVEPLMKDSNSKEENVCSSFLIINNKSILLQPTHFQPPSFSVDNVYTKMHKPKACIENKAPEGYLDMSGSPARIANGYTSIEIKNLIENSQQNNGYIDRRSIPKVPFPMNVNSNGYIAFKKN